MIRQMGLSEELRREEISDFERGRRVPSLLVTLHYARAFGVFADVLIDDELELPQKSKVRRKNISSRV
jgi:transcriptional regulator with XRE-family HTH domain